MDHRSSGCLPAEKFPTSAIGRQDRGPSILLSFRSGKLGYIVCFRRWFSFQASAVHHTREDPREISLTTLFEQLGMAVPHSKSVRKKILTQHHTSVMHQLNNAPVLKGALKVSLRLNKEKTDWLLLAWVEVEEKLPDLFTSESPLVEAWRKSGRPESDLAKLLRAALPEMPGDTKDLAKIASVDLEKSERFLRLCILLLGKNRLHRMLGELKVEVIEGRGPHNPTGTLIWRLLTEISQPVRANRLNASSA